MGNKQISKKRAIRKQIRNTVLKFEDVIGKLPGALFNDAFPLKHTFVDGAYVRQITMPKGALLTSKIHKIKHPYFIMKGDVSVLTEGGTKRIKAPYAGITPAGTKRLLYIHEETVWITVHVTKETDLEKIEEEIIAKNFKELGVEVDEVTLLENDRIAILNFIKSIPELKKEVICLG